MSDMPPPPPEPVASTAPPAPLSPPPGASPAPAAAPPATAPPSPLGPLGQPRSMALVILLTFLTLGIWALVWSFQNGGELKRHARSGLGGLVYLLLTFFIYPVAMFLLASEVEQLYRRRGLQPPVTTLTGLWFVLPVVGNLIWYVKVQGALNDYWTRVAAEPAA